MNNEELLERLDALAIKLGTTAEYLWAELVYGCAVRAWIGFGASVVVFAAAVIGVLVGARMLRSRDVDWEAGGLFLSLVSTCLVVCSFAYGVGALGAALTPEVTALEKLAGMVR